MTKKPKRNYSSKSSNIFVPTCHAALRGWQNKNSPPKIHLKSTGFSNDGLTTLVMGDTNRLSNTAPIDLGQGRTLIPSTDFQSSFPAIAAFKMNDNNFMKIF